MSAHDHPWTRPQLRGGPRCGTVDGPSMGAPRWFVDLFILCCHVVRTGGSSILALFALGLSAKIYLGLGSTENIRFQRCHHRSAAVCMLGWPGPTLFFLLLTPSPRG
ncbi:hypothetical protein BJ912DRAFT_982293, partial [Pholiota molesta]